MSRGLGDVYKRQVIFTNGQLVDGDTITIYYGASDEVICKAELSVKEILNILNVGI